VNYWLMKSEPDVFSIDALKRRPKSRASWDGVRNYQARNMLRDDFRVGDAAFFYHSSCAEPGIVGIMRVVSKGYPDPTALDRRHPQFDPKSKPDNPSWFMVDVEYVKHLTPPISLATLKQHQAQLADLWILRPGNRLSITPVSASQWKKILTLSTR
jgi:predicted RNA-binding protein with PUA-like domain